MMGTELGVDVELCGVFWLSLCDVGQSVKRIKVTDPLFLNHYTLSLVDVYKWCSQQFICVPLLRVFSNSVLSSVFPYSCVLFKICNAYAEIGLF